ncbi:hypothetical protein NGC36_12725 [Serratia rubidaea]|uniref:hypothetical protein n=1 Tax=Serratia rubidaea TaxID=61652 RepID=UPI002DBC4C55|nr:hypothetical protein [Serratia rubidaea]MEB7586135.1 hypothetical protein [Serratia rubidaea]
MSKDTLDFYEDDEGMVTQVVLEEFGSNEVDIIYLESDEVDQQLEDSVDFLREHQNEMSKSVTTAIKAYIKDIYHSDSTGLELMKVYVFPGEHEEFGLLFRWEGDVEHGVGARLTGLNVVKVGSAEVAFV